MCKSRTKVGVFGDANNTIIYKIGPPRIYHVVRGGPLDI
jgi:hypothetical protein